MKCVRSLTLDGIFPPVKVSKMVSDRTCFAGLWYIRLQNNEHVVSVESLGHIRVAVLRQLVSLEGLGKENGRIIVEDCSRIIDFSPLRFVDTVELLRCDGFKNAEELDHCKRITIQYKFLIFIDLKPLAARVQHLSFDFVYNAKVFGVEGLENIPVIDLRFIVCSQKYFVELMKHLFAGTHEKIILLGGIRLWSDQIISDSYDRCITKAAVIYLGKLQYSEMK